MLVCHGMGVRSKKSFVIVCQFLFALLVFSRILDCESIIRTNNRHQKKKNFFLKLFFCKKNRFTKKIKIDGDSNRNFLQRSFNVGFINWGTRKNCVRLWRMHRLTCNLLTKVEWKLKSFFEWLMKLQQWMASFLSKDGFQEIFRSFLKQWADFLFSFLFITKDLLICNNQNNKTYLALKK